MTGSPTLPRAATPGSPTSGSGVLRDSIRTFRGRLTLASVLFCCHQAGEALVPVLVGVAIDQAVGTGSIPALLLWLAVLGADFLFLSTSYRFGARHAWHADVHADARLRMLIAGRLLDPRGGAESGRLPGGLVSVAVSDAKRVAIVNFALPLGLSAIAAVTVAAVSLLTISLPLGLLILLGTPPLLWLVQLVGRPLERRSEPEQERAAQASGVAADLVTGHPGAQGHRRRGRRGLPVRRHQPFGAARHACARPARRPGSWAPSSSPTGCSWR